MKILSGKPSKFPLIPGTSSTISRIHSHRARLVFFLRFSVFRPFSKCVIKLSNVALCLEGIVGIPP